MFFLIILNWISKYEMVICIIAKLLYILLLNQFPVEKKCIINVFNNNNNRINKDDSKYKSVSRNI